MKNLFLILMTALVLVIPVVTQAAALPTAPLTHRFYNSRLYSTINGNGLFFMGVANSANNDTFYVDEWVGFGDYPTNAAGDMIVSGTDGDDYLNGSYYLTCLHTGDSGAPEGEYRAIESRDASAHMVVCADFSADVAVGERIAFIHKSLVDAAVTEDSLSYLHKIIWGASGFPALTATKFAAAGGVSLGEGLLFMHNTLDTINTENEYHEDMLEALRDSLEDANDLLQALTGANKFSVWSEPVEVVVNFSLAGWKTAAAHTLLTITGDVEFEISAHCSSNVASTSSDSLWIFLGESGATGYRMLSALAEDMDAGENLIPVNYSGRGWVWTAAGLSINVGGILRGTSFMGKDIKFEISDHAFTGGIVIFHVRWRPLTTGGNVVAGTGA